ncbi:MAG: hypothetical protein WCV50_05870 [Patescibacteria group bacterium]|jgi:hypothetical protein
MADKNQTLNEVTEDKIVKGNKSIPTGQHLTVKLAENSTFVVKSGAKLTIGESRNNRVFYEANAEVKLGKQTGTLLQEV